MHDEGGLLLILPIFGQRQHFLLQLYLALKRNIADNLLLVIVSWLPMLSADKRFRPALAGVVLGLSSLLILPESSTSVSFLCDKNRFKHCFLMP